MRLFLKLTSRCNRKCGYCYYNTGYLCDPVTQEPTLDELKQRMVDAKKLGADSVSFTGGEPFVRDEVLLELIEFADSLGMKSVVVTNGDYLIQPIDERLQSTLNKVMCMAISLHIDINTNISEYFSKLRTIVNDSLAFYTKRIRFNMALTKHNYCYLSECLSFAQELGIDINIQPVVVDCDSNVYPDYCLNLLTDSEKDQVCEQLLRWGSESDNEIYAKKFCDFLHNGTADYDKCLAGKNFFVVLEDGQVLPCFYREDCVFGAIDSNSIASIKDKLNAFVETCKYCANEQCITMTEFGKWF